MDEQAVRALRQEISELVATDREHGIRGSFVAWEDRKQHDARLARIQEIKEQLAALLKGNPYKIRATIDP